MHQTLVQRYENNCLMLLDQREDTFHFLGTAFVIESNGYLLTAAHILENAERPVVVTPSPSGAFTPLAMENAVPFPVEISRIDPTRGLALLRMEIESPISTPDDFIGNPDELSEGTYLLAFGVSFGHFRIHQVMVMRAMLSAKLTSPNGTNLLVFDSGVHPGDVGGPLVNAEDGRIVGLIQGTFNPLHFQNEDLPENYNVPTKFSYAVSIDYAKPMLEAEGINMDTALSS